MAESVLAKRNFWVRNARNSQAEVDFVQQYDRHLLPIEIKSGDNSKLKSLHLFMEQSQGTLAVRFWNNPLSKDTVVLPSGKQYTLLNVPFYYAECVDEVIKNPLKPRPSAQTEQTIPVIYLDRNKLTTARLSCFQKPV